MELDYPVMGKRIAQRRKALKIKQHNLAEEIGISNNYLSSIERGREKPSLEVFVSICNCLNVSPDYLLIGTMHSNNVPQDIYDELRLCTKEELALIKYILQFFMAKKPEEGNLDKFD